MKNDDRKFDRILCAPNSPPPYSSKPADKEAIERFLSKKFDAGIDRYLATGEVKVVKS